MLQNDSSVVFGRLFNEKRRGSLWIGEGYGRAATAAQERTETGGLVVALTKKIIKNCKKKYPKKIYRKIRNLLAEKRWINKVEQHPLRPLITGVHTYTELCEFRGQNR